MDTLTLFWGIFSVVVGIIAGGGTVFVMMRRANENVELKNVTEKLLAENVPPQVVSALNSTANRALDTVDSAVTVLKETLIFLRDVTDNQPNVAAQETLVRQIGVQIGATIANDVTQAIERAEDIAPPVKLPNPDIDIPATAADNSPIG